MKLTKMLIICLIALLLAACSGDEDAPLQLSGGQNSATLSWAEPRINTDGSALKVNEITTYRIYLGENQNTLRPLIDLSALANPNSYIINYDTNQISRNTTLFIAMTAINDQGVESNFSEVISFNTN
jgi:ABC-type glycerol-3-phosphate transport system substrate-binding protein